MSTITLTDMRVRSQGKPHGDMAEAEFRERFSALLASAPHLLHGYAFFFCTRDTAAVVRYRDRSHRWRAGDRIRGWARVARPRAGSLGATGFPTLDRIGDRGDVFRGTRCSDTFVVREAGRLFVGNFIRKS